MQGTSIAAIAIFTIGCGSSGSSATDATVMADAHLNLSSFTGTVADNNTAAAIPGAMVCTHGLPSDVCATTDNNGKYTITLDVPDGLSHFAGTTTATGYLGRETLYTENSTAANGHVVAWSDVGGLLSTADATAYLATAAGFTYPTNTSGFLRVLVLDASAHLVAATATISPAVAGSGPVYLGASGVPDRTQTDTSVGGSFLFGNLPAGTYAVTVQAPGKTCTVDLTPGEVVPINGEWPPVGTETLSVAVRANMITVDLAVQCN
jgi:hypothetical protein